MIVPKDIELNKEFFEANKSRHVPLENIRDMLVAKRGLVVEVRKRLNYTTKVNSYRMTIYDLSNQFCNIDIGKLINSRIYIKECYLIKRYFLHFM